ncbi:MAG: acyl--CoA ligase [Prevotella sp.]|nr:acyl--CoA ligase [Prevotella sp.]
MNRLEDYLALHAQETPEKIAVVCNQQEPTVAGRREKQYSYEELYQLVCQRAEELTPSKPPRGEAFCSPPRGSWRGGIPFRSSQSIDFLVEYMAIHMAGAAAAPLEHDISEERFDEIARLLAATPVPEGTADVLFTTGTTGRSKGVIMSHRTILADAENLIDGQGFTPDIVFVISGPLNHIGSLSKIWPVIMQGATLYITNGMKNVEEFFTALNYVPRQTPLPLFATFLVPASIRILLQFSHDRLASYASKIDFLETGAAPMMQSDMEELCRVLPHTRLYNTYASTETGIITTYDYNNGKCQAGCLGRPMKHARLFITPEGFIACQGPTLMTGYINAPKGEKAQSVQITPPSGESEGAFITADRGFIDDEGMLHLLGRDDDTINVGGFKVAPTEVEDTAMSLPDVADCVCIAADHPIAGRALKLLVVMTRGAVFDKRTIARYLKSRLESYKVPLLYEQVERVNRTYNGKLDRKSYR